uniref:Immunoglobulin domain-containing protein n=1 Tax=Pundamilia nyererei TaxID=303518 RepID=A0A3B4F904_9CICH
MRSICVRTIVAAMMIVTKIESYAGYSVSFSCLYQPQYQNNLKYICRGTRPSIENGRFRLNDVKMSRIFTVTISSLTQSDSGHYLCGVQTNSDHDVFSAVELRVKVLNRGIDNCQSILFMGFLSNLIILESIISQRSLEEITYKNVRILAKCSQNRSTTTKHSQDSKRCKHKARIVQRTWICC